LLLYSGLEKKLVVVVDLSVYMLFA
jgi:hypothetical protein